MSGSVAWSRQRMQSFMEEKLDLSVLDDSQRCLLVPWISEQLCRPNITTAELLRFIFLTPELAPFRMMSNTGLARFLRCSEGNVSRVLRALQVAPHPSVAVPTIIIIIMLGCILRAAHFMHAFASRSHCSYRSKARRVIFLSCALSLSCRD